MVFLATHSRPSAQRNRSFSEWSGRNDCVDLPRPPEGVPGRREDARLDVTRDGWRTVCFAQLSLLAQRRIPVLPDAERLLLRNIGEHNTFDTTLSLNFLVTYRVNAGTVFYVGYDDHHQQVDLVERDLDGDGIED